MKRKCLYAFRALFLGPNGNVYPCESFYTSMGNVTDKKFKDIWNGEKYVKFRQPLLTHLMPGCARCCKL